MALGENQVTGPSAPHLRATSNPTNTLMQRKSTPLQRLRQEHPFIPDEVLQTALSEANGDVLVATERLQPRTAVPPRDQRPSQTDTVTTEVAVSVVESAAVSSVMQAKGSSIPTDLPSNNPFKNLNNPIKNSNNPFKKLLLQNHEWYPE